MEGEHGRPLEDSGREPIGEFLSIDSSFEMKPMIGVAYIGVVNRAG
jgi:hypothetical protein